jgi:CHASE2 domain-containing sensor protein
VSAQGAKVTFRKLYANNNTRLMISLSLAAALWLTSFLGGFAFMDHLVYDKFIQFTLLFSNIEERVAVVEIPSYQSLNEDEYIRLIDILNSKKPAQIVFNFLPDNMSRRFFDKVRQYDNIVIGWDSEIARRVLVKENIPNGAVITPPIDYGVHRRQQTRMGFKGLTFSTMEVVAASRIPDTLPNRLEESQSWPNDFLVNFRGSAGSLTTIPVNTVLEKRWTPPNPERTAILVGKNNPHIVPPLATPTTPDLHPMSLTEFQGHALNTLITSSPIMKLDQLIKLFLFLLITIITFFLYKRLDKRTTARITLSIALAYFPVKYFTFAFFLLWLPIEELILLQILHFLLGIRRNTLTLDLEIHDILLNLNTKLRERYFPTTTIQMQEYWTQVVTMVTETLSLNRLIFLEREGEDHRVKEVASYNCSLSDIDERRRDYLRFPYQDALKSTGPMKVTGDRLYLRRKEDDEEQYLVPLTFAENVLGFWSFGIDPENARSIPNFNALIRNYARIIGELLYHRKEILGEQDLFGGMVRYLSKGRENDAYDAVKQTLELLKHQFDNLYNAFNSLTTRTIVYDLFGKPTEINTLMAELLESENINPHETSLTSLLEHLTSRPIDEIRPTLRNVIVDRSTPSYKITLSGSPYILTIKPLELSSRLSEFYCPTPFGIHGIICEIIPCEWCNQKTE